MTQADDNTRTTGRAQDNGQGHWSAEDEERIEEERSYWRIRREARRRDDDEAADGIITGYRMRKRFVRYDLNGIDAALQPFGGSRYDLTEVDDALKPYGGGLDASPEKAESRPDPATSGRPSPTRHIPPAPDQKPFPNNSKGQIR